jgi:hypothetical protein
VLPILVFRVLVLQLADVGHLVPVLLDKSDIMVRAEHELPDAVPPLQLKAVREVVATIGLAVAARVVLESTCPSPPLCPSGHQ